MYYGDKVARIERTYPMYYGDKVARIERVNEEFRGDGWPQSEANGRAVERDILNNEFNSNRRGKEVKKGRHKKGSTILFHVTLN